MESDVQSIVLTANGFVSSNPVRVRGIASTGAGAVTNPVNIHNVATAGAVAAGNLKISVLPTVSVGNYMLLPGRGVRFETKAYVVVGDAASVTIFYEG